MNRIFNSIVGACLMACTVLLTGCQSQTRLATADRFQLPGLDCEASIAELLATIDSAQAHNPAYQRIEGWSPLRGNRFLASFAGELESEPDIATWFERVRSLTIEALVTENANLPEPVDLTGMRFIATCLEAATSTAESRARLVNETVLSRSSYSNLQPFLGIRPLMRQFYRQTTLALHEEERREFLAPVEFSSATTYLSPIFNTLPGANDIPRLFAQAYAGGTLGIPAFQQRVLDALFQLHAPGFRIEYRSDDDLIGLPVGSPGGWEVDVDYPVVFMLPSMTRLETETLLQLNYIAWFPARTAEGAFDLYAGELDSIIWRVTLDTDGAVLLYDSIHSCGCYHKYYRVSERLLPRQEPLSGEPANIFDTTWLADGEPLLISVTAGRHFIVGLENADGAEFDRRYSMADYRDLYRPGQGRNRSLFDQRGLVAGSGRAERFLLWPSGVISAGAMRQWGTHATGFVEEQHFDDAFLLERYFQRSR